MPADVWDWHLYDSWRDPVSHLASEIFGTAVVEEFCARRPDRIFGDNLNWLDSIVARITGHDQDSRSIFEEGLRQRFRAIRACHATRTEDVASYYEHGLRVMDLSQVQARFREIFLSGEFRNLTTEDLARAVETVNTEGRGRFVDFDTNEERLIDTDNHYLKYGCEYLYVLASRLPCGTYYRKVLSRFGQPTMFICDIPLSQMNKQLRLAYAGEALARVFSQMLTAEVLQHDEHYGGAVYIEETLDPEHIVGHYAVTAIPDPL